MEQARAWMHQKLQGKSSSLFSRMHDYSMVLKLNRWFSLNAQLNLTCLSPLQKWLWVFIAQRKHEAKFLLWLSSLMCMLVMHSYCGCIHPSITNLMYFDLWTTEEYSSIIIELLLWRLHSSSSHDDFHFPGLCTCTLYTIIFNCMAMQPRSFFYLKFLKSHVRDTGCELVCVIAKL